jgi:1-deoxy-D-xylulose-5-phosphate reductoisomerase
MAITPERAVRHPNWKMGPKISVDSATLMNKGLELIEASYLFDWEPSHIDTWIHPQSLVHGAIWLNDGSCQLQLSLPDMRSAIGFALSYPERLTAAVERPSLSQMGRLDFLEPDHRRFPGIALARAALSQGEGSAIALNAANEVAVQAFLDKRLAFPHIFSVVENVLKRPWPREIDSVETVYTVDHDARRAAKDTF